MDPSPEFLEEDLQISTQNTAAHARSEPFLYHSAPPSFSNGTCSICGGPPQTEALRCIQGHPICANCFVNELGQNATCPKCEKPSRTSPAPHVPVVNSAVARTFQSQQLLELPCPNAALGCPEKLVTNLDRAAHLAQCGYVMIRCSATDAGCKWTGFRKNKNEHDLQCEKKQVTPETSNPFELQQLCRRQQEWLKVLHAQMSSKDQQIQSLSQAFSDRMQQIAILQKELNERSQQMLLMQQELAKRDALINSLHNTLSELKEKPTEPRRKASSGSTSQRSPKTPRAVNSPPEGVSSPYESVWAPEMEQELRTAGSQWINVSFPTNPSKHTKN